MNLEPGDGANKKVKAVDFLLILRAFAGFTVVVHHVFASLPATSLTSLMVLGWFNGSFLLDGCGQVGVAIFFCLSGYLMAKAFVRARYSLSTRGVRSFYQNRFVRIVPLYLFYICIAVTIGVTHANSPAEFDLILVRLLTFQYSSGLANGSSILFSHLWTVSVEVQFYLMVPVLMAFQMKSRPSQHVAMLGLVVLLILGASTRAIMWHIIGYNYLRWDQAIYEPIWMNIDLFVGGMLLNFVASKPILVLRKLHVGLFCLAITLYYILGAAATYEGLTMHINSLFIDIFIIGVPSLTLLFSLAMIHLCERLKSARIGEQGLSRVVLRLLRFGEFLGRITFGIYLFHVAFIYRDWPYLSAGTPLILFCSILGTTCFFTVITAFVTYYGVEVTSMRLKAKM